jgi:tetratricopeptide (TPR) repeat protein
MRPFISTTAATMVTGVLWGAAMPGRALAAAGERPRDFAAARALYDDSRYDEAQRIFERLAAERPDDPEIDFYLGRLALWFDDAAKGLALLQKAERAAPGDARMQNALGDAYGLTAQRVGFFAKIGWAKKSLAAYERAIALDPKNSDYRWSLMNYCQQAPGIVGGGMARAYAEAAEIEKLAPDTGRIAFATLAVAERKYDRAFAALDEVLRRAPDNFLALYHLGRCAALSGQRLDRGRAALERCLALPQPPGAGAGKAKYVHVRFYLGKLLDQLGDNAAARAEYVAALADNPSFRPAQEALKR